MPHWLLELRTAWEAFFHLKPFMGLTIGEDLAVLLFTFPHTTVLTLLVINKLDTGYFLSGGGFDDDDAGERISGDW